MRPLRSSRLTRPRGFTLIECVLATAASSMLMLGLASVMMLASNTSLAASNQTSGSLRSLLDQLRDDAASASVVTQLTATGMTLIVPDQTGDGVADEVAYNWTNAASTGTIARDLNGVRRLIAIGAKAITFTPTVSNQTINVVSASPEVLLFRHAPPLAIGIYAIKSNQSAGQSFGVSLPAGAVSWNVTRVRLPIRSKGATGGIIRVQVRSATSGIPGLVLGETELKETSLLETFATREISFDAASTSQTSSKTTASLTLQWQKDADAAEVQYATLTSALSGSQWVGSTDGAVSWTATPLRGMPLEVYGTYTLGSGSIVRQLTAMAIEITPKEPALQTPLKTTVRFANAPEVRG